MTKGWHGNSKAHSLASKGIRTKCDVPNPMNSRSNKELLFGHSLTHSKNYQMGVGVENARCEHDRLVAKMLERGMEHKSPFESKLTKREERETRKTLNPFALFDDPKMAKATKQIKRAIESGDQDKVIRVSNKWEKLGAVDTASREAITEYYNKVHQKDGFDYEKWYK